jgi:AmmeMemoRadiSam system protein B
MSSTPIREPAVAGRFYPADAAELAAALDALLDSVDEAAAEAAREAPGFADVAADGMRPRALVVPHAGYRYSGGVAAAGYARVRGEAPSRVVLVGPPHHVAVRGSAVPRASAWRTPLGEVPVDGAAREAALATAGTVADDRPHAPEHALEVQLPFLQRALRPGFAVLPVVTTAPPDVVADLLDAVVDRRGTLVVTSTDLSHYLPEEAARAHDARTNAAVLALAPDRIGDRAACGAHALRGLLAWARRHGLRPELLAAATSADAGASPDRVVGYASYAFRPAPSGMTGSASGR